MGAYHSGDLAYTFGTLDRVGLGWNDWDRTLSNTLMNYWINFARTGDPNGAGLPHWPAYQATEDLVLEFGEDIQQSLTLEQSCSTFLMQLDLLLMNGAKGT